MRMNAIAEHRESLFQVELPEGFPKLMLRTFGDIIHQHMQLSLFPANSREERLDLLHFQMIHYHSNAFAAARGYQLRGLFDGFRPAEIVFGRQAPQGSFFRALCPRTAASAIYRRACFTKRQSRAAPHAAR